MPKHRQHCWSCGMYPKVSLVFVVIVLLLRWSGNSTALRLTSLQYKIKGRENLYGKGHDDAYTVVFLIAVLFSVGTSLSTRFLSTRRILGVKVKRSILRGPSIPVHLVHSLLRHITVLHFASWIQCGRILGRAERDCHDNNPHLASSANFKWFYLAEIAFWTHMILTTF